MKCHDILLGATLNTSALYNRFSSVISFVKQSSSTFPRRLSSVVYLRGCFPPNYVNKNDTDDDINDDDVCLKYKCSSV